MMFVRHARDLTLRNVQFTYVKPDERPPFVLVDVHGLTFDRIRLDGKPVEQSMVRQTNSSDVVIK